jgi:hypothetical protein
MIKRIVEDPSLLSKELLKQVNYDLHGPLCKSQIILDDSILVYHKPFAHSGSYTHLTLVPQEFCNILFVVFHSNPIGKHLNKFWMLHHLRLCYYWPRIFS